MTCSYAKDVGSTTANVVGPRTMETGGAANKQWAGSLARMPLRYRDDPLHGPPSLLAAIAQTLSNIGGGTVADHLSGAQRLLEEAFRAVEQADEKQVALKVSFPRGFARVLVYSRTQCSGSLVSV